MLDTSAPYTERERALIEAAYRWALLAREEGFDAGKFDDAGVRDGLPPVPAPEASRLFERLASGKLPLAHAPPTKDGLPWYDVIENDTTQEINADVLKPVDTDLLPSTPLGYIPIHGAYWRIIEIVEDGTEYILTFGKYPMRWRLKWVSEGRYELSREGLSAWVWQGAVDPNPFLGYPNQAYGVDQHGPRWIVAEPESARPNRWIWLRVEYDDQERVGRYVRFIVPLTDQQEGQSMEQYLQQLSPLDGHGLSQSIYVVDRNRLGRILRAFHVPLSATPWAQEE